MQWLQSLATNILTSYLGSWVEVDSKSLQIGLWNGRLTLTNLAIKPALLDKVDIPLTLVKGSVGSFELQVNWARLRSVPVQVTISDVFLLVRARERQDLDAKQIEEYLQRQKRAVLDSTARHFARRIFSQGLSVLPRVAFAHACLLVDGRGRVCCAAPASGGGDSGLVSTIVDNLQITLQNLHVCIEGALGSPAAAVPYSAGFFIHSLSMHSTDESTRLALPFRVLVLISSVCSCVRCRVVTRVRAVQ
jgi:vacuolar protein sorting-associated protein 13A/C